jgi:cold shock CspA family protein
VVERRRRHVKTHAEPHAFVVRKFDGEGYGFLKTPDGREIYFHQNAVVGTDYERLEVGTQVRFEETMGDMGPQATTVRIVDKPGHRAGESGAEAAEPPAGW